MTDLESLHTAASGDDRWFYRTGEGKSGPVSLGMLSDLIATGALSQETPVWRHGLDSWLPASACAELREAVAAHQALTTSSAGKTVRLPGTGLLVAAGLVAVVVAWQVLTLLLSAMAAAHVTGTVTAASGPVTGGCVIIAPIGEGKAESPGKPGVAAILPDGRYSLRISPGSGGLAKRFAVRFSPPVLPPMGETEALTAVPPYSGLVPKTREVSLHAGSNTLDIEIVPAVRD